MTALPSLDLSPFVIFVDPVGPTEPRYPNLTMAVETARRLEVASHRVQSIRNDTTIVKGAKLRSLLGEPPERPPLFLPYS
jgi:hypothetical protein